MNAEAAVEGLNPWPILTPSDHEAVARVLRSGRLLGGDEAAAFAREWAEYVGVPGCIGVSSCTHALHLALKVLGVGAGDEVIVPALTYCGTASPVVLAGAVPVFADVEEGTFNLDPDDVRRRLTARTRAIITVHLHGLPSDVGAIARAAPGVPIVEDGCQAHGATRNGRRVGGEGALGCFSLNEAKPLAGGQGGMLVTADESRMKLARLLAGPGGGDHPGFSYALTEMAAAIGRSQLRSLDRHNQRARCNAHRLSEGLRGFEELLPAEPAGSVSVWHKYRLRLPAAVDPDRLAAALRERGVAADRWPGAIVPHRSEYRRFRQGPFPVAERVQAHSVVLGTARYPLAAQSPKTMDRWVEALRRLL